MSADDNGWTKRCSRPVFMFWETNECVWLSTLQINKHKTCTLVGQSYLWAPTIAARLCWNEEMGMNDASGSCGDLQSHRKPAADWCFLSLWNFHTVIFPTARLEVWSASLSLMWGDNSKVCWFESHSISTTLRLLQQTWLPEINQTSCYSSELLSPNLMR